MTTYKVNACVEPTYCPKCESDNISAGHMNTDSMEAWRLVECHSCNFEWDEIYTFSYWEPRKRD